MTISKPSHAATGWDTAVNATIDVANAVAGASYYAADFAAVGDNSTNDTTALQNALNACSAGDWLVLGKQKIYKIQTSALTLPSGVNIDGRGSIIRQATSTVNCLAGVDLINNTLRDLKLSGPTEGSPTGTGKGLVATISANPDTHKLVLERVEVTSFGGNGIDLANPILSSFYNVTSEANGGHGFSLHGVFGGAAGTSCSFVSTYANGNAQAGYALNTMTYCGFLGAAADSNGIGYWLVACEGVSFSGCGAEGTLKNGGTYNGYSWKVDSSIAVSLQGCWTYASSNIGFWFTNTSTNCVILACRENSPAIGVSHNVQLDAASTLAAAAISGTTSNLFSGTKLTWL